MARLEPRTLTLTERPEVPLDGLLLGWGGMAPFPVLAGAMWLAGPDWAALAARGLVLWGAAILLFLSGVRRGLSFRTEGGPRMAQLAMFAWLFGAGLAALVLPVGPALWLLALAYASVWAVDPWAARRGDAPLYFARLRPVQMAVPVGEPWWWRGWRRVGAIHRSGPIIDGRVVPSADRNERVSPYGRYVARARWPICRRYG